MKTMKLCPRCAKPLAADALLGLCPECMMKAGLDSNSLDSPPASPTEPGSRVPYFGDYELLEEVARGGMGVVWKARQVSLNRIVAVKMILSGQLAGEAEVKRFRTEAEAAAKLQHPNIVAIHEVGTHEGQHYFSMDFVEGQSLAEMVFHRPLPPEQAAKYLQAIADAIHYAHQRGVLHRDLKPSNVLIDHAGQPRVTDFGLAKLAERDSGLTHSGAVLGSPSYMSPEQASGKTREIGPATDIYSLGAILYELITGRPPFRAATPLDTMRMVVEAETAAPRWVNPAVPADVETICLKCLEKDPRRRYASAQALADDLRRFLHHEPILACPATRLYRAQKWIKRKPAIAALAGVSALAALVLVAGLWRYAATLRTHSAEIRQRLHFTLIEQARAQRLLGNREAALQHVAEAAATKRTVELRTEAIQTLAQPGVRRVFDAPINAIVASQFSADGRLLAIGGEGYVMPDWPGYATNAWQSFVRFWEVPSGRLLGTVRWNLESGLFAVSPDARWLAVPQTDDDGRGGIAIWSVAGSNVTARIPAVGPSQFSPDVKRLAVQESNRVSVWNLWSAGFSPLQVTNVPAALAVPATVAAAPRSGINAALHDSPAAIFGWTGPEELLLQELPEEGHGRLLHWNVATGKETFPLNDTAYVRPARGGPAKPLPGHKLDAATEVAVAISPDYRAAATRRLTPLSTPEELFIRDLHTGNELGTVRLAPFPDRLLLGAQGRRLLFPDSVEPGRLRVYDVNSDKFLVGVGEPGVQLASAFYRVIHGGLASSGSSASGTDLMRWESRHLRWFASDRPSTNVQWSSPVRNFSPDGSLFAADISTSERNVVLWELDSSRRFAVIPNAWSPVWSADSRWLAVETSGMLKVRDGSYTSGNFGRVHEVLHGVPTHRLSSAPRRITFSPGGRQLTANLDQLRGSLLWNVERAGGRVNLHLTTNRLRENEIFFATNTTWVLNDRNHVRAFSLALAAPLGQTPEPLSTNDSSTVLARALTPDGRRLLLTCMAPHWATNAAFNGDHLQLWDLAERRRLAVWPHPGSDKNFGSGSQHGPLAFSPDGRRFALACFGGSGIEIWDTATGKRIHELHQPKPTYAWQGARPSVAAQIFRAVFRVKSGPPAPTPARHFMEASVKAIEFTPDSRLVVSCAEDRAVLRDVESGRELTQCRGATNMLSLAISPDGGTLATGEEDGHLRLWDLPSGRELAHWPAHNAAVTALAFSPDGETLASGARDATMKLWNLLFLRRELAKLGLDW